jgi:deazaflavin-dependent oxidoreductase (nitroreductase family)
MPQSDPHQERKYLYLTTVGRVSGQPREIEIWFVESQGKFYVLAEHFREAHWVKNIERNPRVRVRLDQAQFDATARVLDPEGDCAAWEMAQRLSNEKYGWGEGLPVELEREKKSEETRVKRDP